MIELPPKSWQKSELPLSTTQLEWVILAIETIVAELNAKEAWHKLLRQENVGKPNV